MGFDLERWIAYRTYDKYHVIRVDGVGYHYADKDDQMLGATFGLLVDFVEIECAGIKWACGDKNTKFRRFLLRLRPWKKERSRTEGLAWLEWSASLKNDEDCGCQPGDPGYGELSSQAKACAEKLVLYHWWVDERPKRPDPMEASGAYAAHDTIEEDPERWHAAAMKSHEIEEAQHAEDQAMLHRLVDIRRSLWT